MEQRLQPRSHLCIWKPSCTPDPSQWQRDHAEASCTTPSNRRTMLNKCFMENKIPTLWRQSKIIAILKPGKDSAIPNRYRPISLLCHRYKLYERMILNRIAPTIVGFRPVNLTQYIEDGYQEGMITGTAFVDLSAAYNTVNHILLIQKLFNITQYSTLCRVIRNLLSNRRLYVELNNERSRWRLQKNDLPQGSVLSPTLFNIYTNYKPVHDGTRSFIYVDDRGITAQFPTFSQGESTIEEALGELTEYYRNNSMRANPDKTQVTAFHLRNREANRCLLCLPTPLTLVCGGSPIIPPLVHQPAYLSIWPAAPSLQRGLSKNPGVSLWCVCGCS